MFCGIDLGSRNVKLAVAGRELIANHSLDKIDFYKFDTIDFYRNYGKKVDDQLVIDFDKLGLGQFKQVVSTGYGRNTLNLLGAINIPELKAHMLGATFQTGITSYTLLDLGGQDSKIIKVHNGKMIDFQTNDKCAASSGRYLENMAAVLGLSLEELSSYYENPVDLNATCAIFGESELVGRIVEGHEISSLAAGVNYTIVKRIVPMLTALLTDVIVFTGGVAKNQAVKRLIENQFNSKVVIPDFPQFNGAIGCLIYGINNSE